MPLVGKKKRLPRALSIDSTAGNINSILIQAASSQQISQITTDVNTLLRTRHKIQTGASDDFTVRNLTASATSEVARSTVGRVLGVVTGVARGAVVAMLLLGSRAAAPAGTRFDPAARQFLLPGSWVPMALIVGVFLIKYSVGVQLALEPTLARHLGFAIAVTALYGLLSGLFAVRALRVLRLAGRPVLQAG